MCHSDLVRADFSSTAPLLCMGRGSMRHSRGQSNFSSLKGGVVVSSPGPS